MRTALLAAARSPRLRRTAEHSRVTRPVVSRYIAGTDERDALSTVEALVADGLQVTLDHLGENGTREQAQQTANAYVSVLGALAELGLGRRAEVSVKLSAIGQLLPDGEALATDYARLVCAAAAKAGTTVTLDMEDHTTTDSTLRILAALRGDYPWVGAVLQAYLRRTESDCHDLASIGSRVRLCKGAYAEPESVAFRGAEVDDAYRRCLDVLFAGAGHPMIATHDPSMIAAARAAAQLYGRAPDSYEFQMLYGIRRDEQRALVAHGEQVRVYVPYGTEWYDYFVRRLAERPANLALLVRSLFELGRPPGKR
ncbi:MAG: proline dehydrogenase [Pseudonocardiales bacterium]|jgi:proline dehydrogenase|nr:proline dehydrogenase [Pseudonocardiales bacterium]